MKKKIIIMLSVMIGVTVLGIGIYQSDASQRDPKLSTDEIEQLVKNQYDGAITTLELSKDFNQVSYHVEVISNEKEYDLTLDGNTGEILHLKEKIVAKSEQMELDEQQEKQGQEEQQEQQDQQEKQDTERTDVPSDEAEQNGHQMNKKQHNQKHHKHKKNPVDESLALDAKQAIDVALGEFSGTITEVELDRNNGRYIYEVEMYSGKMKVEIEVDAETGEMINKKERHNKHNKYQTDKAAVIDAKQAIDIALNEFAGIISEMELDRDNGRLIYEVEIQNGDTEAEVEIDAYTGEIIKIELD